MKKSILAAAIIAATASVAFAQAPDSDSSLTGKAMKDQPGTTGGSTPIRPPFRKAASPRRRR